MKIALIGATGFVGTAVLNEALNRGHQVYPTRKDLATIYDRLRRTYYPLSGTADHGVSEALYMNDPDGNGVELYWDRPRDQWPYHPDGSLEMYTHALDLDNLLKALDTNKGPASN